MVKRLILVAAPSCCGKTTFIKQLREGKLKNIEKKIDVPDFENWLFRDIYLHEKEVLALGNSQQCDLVLHYTIPYPALKYILRNGYDRKARLTIMQGADEITFLTLYANTPTLLNRIELRRQHVKNRRRQGIVPIYKYQRTMRTLKRLEKIYATPNKLISMYRNWFDHCSKIELKNHFLINVENTPRLDTLSNWPRIKKHMVGV